MIQLDTRSRSRTKNPTPILSVVRNPTPTQQKTYDSATDSTILLLPSCKDRTCAMQSVLSII